MNTDKQIRDFLKSLAHGYPNQKIPIETLESHFEILKPRLREADLNRLKEHLLLEQNFFPTVKVIVDEARAGNKPKVPVAQNKEWAPVPQEIKEKIQSIFKRVGTRGLM